VHVYTNVQLASLADALTSDKLEMPAIRSEFDASSNTLRRAE